MSDLQTVDKASTNGKSAGNKDAEKRKVKRRTCGIPMVKSLSEMPLVVYEARVEQQPTEWDRIKETARSRFHTSVEHSQEEYLE